jgi:hypothetical protein
MRSLAAIFRLKTDITGLDITKGWNAGKVPCTTLSHGRTMSIPKVVSVRAPPAVWTHLLIQRPESSGIRA